LAVQLRVDREARKTADKAQLKAQVAPLPIAAKRSRQ
jgi:hypothetical protein